MNSRQKGKSLHTSLQGEGITYSNGSTDSVNADNEGVDDDEDHVGHEDSVECHAVHLLGPSVEPVRPGSTIILSHVVSDTFLQYEICRFYKNIQPPLDSARHVQLPYIQGTFIDLFQFGSTLDYTE